MKTASDTALQSNAYAWAFRTGLLPWRCPETSTAVSPAPSTLYIEIDAEDLRLLALKAERLRRVAAMRPDLAYPGRP
jgi:hypothetical protein